MCYSPLHLPNNKLKFDLDKDKLYINAPCGKCGECRQKRSDEITTRLYYEYLDCINTFVPDLHYKSPDGSVVIDGHGYAFLQTLTYNEEMVPWKHGIRCFNPEHYRMFMVNLRNDIVNRDLLIPSPKDPEKMIMPIKVFCASEYGGETYRPHLHLIMYIRGNINPELLEELCRHNWAIVDRKKDKLTGIRNRHSLGWTDVENPYSDKHTHPSELVVDGHVAVMNYVSEYVGKDIDFETVLHHQKNSEFDNEPISDQDYKSMRPFTRQSNGIGECIKDMVTIDDLMDGRITIPDTKQGTKVVSLPMYIDRKVFYKYDPEDKCFRLTDIGYQMKQHRLEHNTSYVKKQIDYLWSSIGELWTDLSEPYIAGLLQDAGVSLSPADCMLKISNILYNRYDDFINYILYYKDIHCVSSYLIDDKTTDLRHYAERFIVKYSEPPVGTPVFNMKDYRETQPVDYRVTMKHSYGTVCNRFKGFDEVLSILNGINLAFCVGKQKQYLKNKAEKARQKRIFKEGIFLKHNKSFHSLNRF